MKRAIIQNHNDNVATLLEAAGRGERVELIGAVNPLEARGSSDSTESAPSLLELVEDLPIRHKVALSDISQGEAVVKYGAPIGVAAVPIKRGSHVHVHNLNSVRGKFLEKYTAQSKDAEVASPMAQGILASEMATNQISFHPDQNRPGEIPTFMGFVRPDGLVGVRNHLLVLPVVICAAAVAEAIAAGISGAVNIYHQYGCNLDPATNADVEKVFGGFGRNPNVGAVILVGLGCETVSIERIAEEIRRSGKPVKDVVIQRDGGVNRSIERGRQIAEVLSRQLASEAREEVQASRLTVAVECGASDAFSGLSANPAIGVMGDLVVGYGGTVVLSETTEMIGAEHILAGQARDQTVGQAVLEIVRRTEQELALIGGNSLGDITPGNIAGGLSTIEEKSLGCIRKAGFTPIQEVVDYASSPTSSGLVIMNTPGHDIESMTGVVAGGAQIIVFSTGLGTPTGSPIAPVIKVSSNSEVLRWMPDVIDVDVGGIVTGNLTLSVAGQKIFRELLDVASGKPTWSERAGHREFAIRRYGTACTLY
ncbi:MAG: altronate dehydratase family protein [Firmicutes bacterium]|nr:altronate dehydratase family protein [Bacillota bacterium]